MSALVYTAAGAALAISGGIVLCKKEKRDSVYRILWDDNLKRLFTLLTLAAATLMLVFGSDKVRTAAEKGLVAFLIVILAEAKLTFAPFWLILAVSFLIA